MHSGWLQSGNYTKIYNSIYRRRAPSDSLIPFTLLLYSFWFTNFWIIFPHGSFALICLKQLFVFLAIHYNILCLPFLKSVKLAHYNVYFHIRTLLYQVQLNVLRVVEIDPHQRFPFSHTMY